jgi:glycosyltransferase involved in cell wall biosynthesis
MIRHRLAIVVSHPIQHFVPLYRALARRQDIVLKVFFATRIGLDTSFDAEMNTAYAWDGDLLEGYDHAFLEEAEGIASVSFRSVNNPSISAALNDFAPSAVLVYGYAQLTALRALLWSRLHGVPVLMAGDGDAVQRGKTLRSTLRAACLRLLMRQVAAVLTVGDQNEIFWARMGIPAAKRFRSPFPIDETIYRHARANRAAMRAATRRRLSIAADAFVFLFVGKLSARKRPADLLAALAKLNKQQPVHLLFCGDGMERASLTAQAAQTNAPCSFAGFVNLDHLPGIYCAADALVIPSEHDPHPLVGSEACAVGLPLIVSDRVGLIGETDIARPGFNALVTACGDIEALARAMQRLVANPELHAAMTEASLTVFEDTCMRHSVDGLLGALDHVRPADEAVLRQQLAS